MIRGGAGLVEALGGDQVGHHRDLGARQQVRDLGGALPAQSESRHRDDVGPVGERLRHLEPVVVLAVRADVRDHQPHRVQAAGAVGAPLSRGYSFEFVHRAAAGLAVGHGHEHPDDHRRPVGRASVGGRAVLLVDDVQCRGEGVVLEVVGRVAQADAFAARRPRRRVGPPVVAGDQPVEVLFEHGDPGGDEYQRRHEEEPQPVGPRAGRLRSGLGTNPK